MATSKSVTLPPPNMPDILLNLPLNDLVVFPINVLVHILFRVLISVFVNILFGVLIRVLYIIQVPLQSLLRLLDNMEDSPSISANRPSNQDIFKKKQREAGIIFLLAVIIIRERLASLS